MQVIENNELFSELSNEESANVSGGTAVGGAQALAGFLAARPLAALRNEDAVASIVTTLAP
ncbi:MULTISPECIES: hypothetical protein [Nostocales]|uniref:hypothetical protein n=1 Tax=Nostocales TaxID=1161 RepID=UPI00029B7BDB|nr:MULTISPECIES: hypothetical protein [Nostocales]AFW94156.1 hypothetical protein ANA_C11378 [Anabaena sp. 90]MTJ17210.1 hypothetical protein [Dolichospermum sp. UHCC 0299]MTJ39084.1 hypothetical protein [Dolichospermum sp. UHCC 0406]